MSFNLFIRRVNNYMLDEFDKFKFAPKLEVKNLNNGVDYSTGNVTGFPDGSVVHIDFGATGDSIFINLFRNKKFVNSETIWSNDERLHGKSIYSADAADLLTIIIAKLTGYTSEA